MFWEIRFGVVGVEKWGGDQGKAWEKGMWMKMSGFGAVELGRNVGNFVWDGGGL